MSEQYPPTRDDEELAYPDDTGRRQILTSKAAEYHSRIQSGEPNHRYTLSAQTKLLLHDLLTRSNARGEPQRVVGFLEFCTVASGLTTFHGKPFQAFRSRLGAAWRVWKELIEKGESAELEQRPITLEGELHSPGTTG